MGKLLLLQGQGQNSAKADSCLDCVNRTGLDTPHSSMHCQAYADYSSMIRSKYPLKCPAFTKKQNLGLFIRIWRYFFAR